MGQLVLLGTGTPNLNPQRTGQATALLFGSRVYLVDCGAGVMQRLAQAQVNGVALDPTRISAVFISHLHADHTLGYADVILSTWINGRTEPLRVYGPRGLRAMTDHLLAAYEADIHERTHSFEGLSLDALSVDVHEIEPGVCYADDTVEVEAFAVDHGGLQAFGYTFRAGGQTVVLSGDTTPLDIVAQQATGADVLIHNAYSEGAVQQRPPRAWAIRRALLTSTRQLAAIAGRARPKRLVLHHLEAWADPAQLLAEVREGYSGEVTIANDDDIIDF